MAEIGIDVGRFRGVSVENLSQLGRIHAVRAIAHRDWDGSDLFAQVSAANLRLWLVFAHESFDGFNSWQEGFDYYRDRYGDYVQIWQPGNEPDLESASSWTMNQED